MFRIRHAAKLAGISPGLLRAWERRYHLVEPTRTASGYRVYSPADVELLTAAASLVGAGHSISEVARLPAAEIRSEANKLGRPAPPRAAGPELPRAAIESGISGAMVAIERFDREGFEAALLPVLSLGALPPAAACEEVLMPLLERIGDAWERGALSVAGEHFGSGLVRAKILQYLQFLARAGQGPRVVCACPRNEAHEGGLLAFAVHAASSGWDLIYLGANTPVSEALATAVRVGADALALSFTSIGPEDREAELNALAAFARDRASPRLLAGGRLAAAHRSAFERAGLLVSETARVPLDPLRPDGPVKALPR